MSTYLSIQSSIHPYRRGYSTVDRDWFLKLANSQQEWRASNQLLNEVVISSSFSGDLVSAMESSLKKARYRPDIVADIPDGCVTLYVFKMILSRLLGYCDQQNNESAVHGAGPLLMYNPEVGVAVIYSQRHLLSINC